MHRRLGIAAVIALAMPLAALNAAAQPPGGLASSVDLSCDYCEDYTDPTRTAAQTRSAYVAGSGYQEQTEGEVTTTAQEREVARLLAQRKQHSGETR